MGTGLARPRLASTRRVRRSKAGTRCRSECPTAKSLGFCHPERSEGSLRHGQRSLAALRMTCDFGSRRLGDDELGTATQHSAREIDLVLAPDIDRKSVV